MLLRNSVFSCGSEPLYQFVSIIFVSLTAFQRVREGERERACQRRKLRAREEGEREYRRFESMLLADASRSCLSLGNVAFTFLMLNGVKSPVGMISATNTGITGVPCAWFFNSAHSYLVLVKFQNAKKKKKNMNKFKKKKRMEIAEQVMRYSTSTLSWSVGAVLQISSIPCKGC